MNINMLTATTTYLWMLVRPTACADPDGYTSHCLRPMDYPLDLTNTSFSTLSSLFATAGSSQDSTTIKAIKNTLALYPLAIDARPLVHYLRSLSQMS